MNLQLPQLSKDALQKITMAVVGLGIVIFCAFNYLLLPLEDELATLKKDVTAQRSLLEKNQKLKGMTESVNAQYRVTGERLLGIMSRQMPPQVNALSWATDYLKVIPNKVSISEAGNVSFPVNKGTVPIFEECLIKTGAACRYHELGRLLADLEKNNPALRIDNLDISGGTSDTGLTSGLLTVNLRLSFLQFNDKRFLPDERPLADEKGAVNLPRRLSAGAADAPAAGAAPSGE